MPDEQGNQKAEEVPGTPLHAYGDGREAEADPGSRGITGDEGTGDPGSFQEGGHDGGSTEFGDTPQGGGDAEDAPGAEAGAGSGAMDPDRAGSEGPRS
ncbi:MAG: hypothetical protein QOE44_2287 [Solirubrobacteraceae bacterium]|jgi:hypothetical protein|nr:hypothetical protein [Solirubrobacteraceae bacterium]